MTRHPVPARLKAYARYQIDFEGEVQQHVRECKDCAELVLQERRSVEADALLHPEPSNAAAS